MGMWMWAVFLSWKGKSSETKESIFLQGGRGASMTGRMKAGQAARESWTFPIADALIQHQRLVLWACRPGTGWFCQGKCWGGWEGSRDLPMDLFNLTECRLKRRQSRWRWAGTTHSANPYFCSRNAHPWSYAWRQANNMCLHTLLVGAKQSVWMCWSSVSNSPKATAGLLLSPW